MSGLQHIEQNVKSHFISGEPGTTGREPFDDSTASGPGQSFSTGQGLTGANTGLGAHSGTGLGHSHGVAGDHSHQHGITGDNTHKHGITGDNSHNHGLTGNNNNNNHGVKDALTGGSGLACTQDHDHSLHDKTTGTGGTGYGAGKHGTDVGLGGGGLTGAAGGPAAAVNSGEGHRDHGDRVGGMGQDSAKYEGSMGRGPVTGGAAGTDRFDSDRTGVAGGVGSGLDRQHDDGVHHDTSQRAPGKSSGGVAGVLATSDKDFTGRDRKGEGAYADTSGPFKLNQSGPGGNTALTGREGNLDENPVAQAKSRDPSAPSATNEHPEGHPEHKGFLQKVKDAIS